jgi:hypothetical protein
MDTDTQVTLVTLVTIRTDITIILTVTTGHTARTVTTLRHRITTGAKSITATIVIITAIIGTKLTES